MFALYVTKTNEPQGAVIHTNCGTDDRPQFEIYQSIQGIAKRKRFTAPYWAVFIVNLNNETMFGGLYNVKYRGLLERDQHMPHIEGQIDKAGTCDVYDLTLDNALCDLIGRLFIDWGPGALAYCPICRSA